MALVILKKVINGGFQTVGTRTVTNLGWLFRHASEVTELHFTKQQNAHSYLLKAVLMNGNVFETQYESRAVFAEVFNRNRTLQGVVVNFSYNGHEERQAVGELTGIPEHNFVDMNGKQIFHGSRVEIGPNYDLWMRGATHGAVTKLMQGSDGLPMLRVCMDRLNKRYSFVAADCKLA